MPVTSIGHRYAPSFRQSQTTYDEALSHWHELTEKFLPPLPRGSFPDTRWKFRHASPLVSVLPHLPGMKPVGREISRAWDNFLRGGKPAFVTGAGRLGHYVASGIKASKTLSEGLFEIFMAHDRYHQARIEEALKRAGSEQINNRFHWENSLDDLVKVHGHNNLMLEIFSSSIRRNQEASSRIIANI